MVAVSVANLMLDEVLQQVNDSGNAVGALKEALVKYHYLGRFMVLATNDQFADFNVDELKWEKSKLSRGLEGTYLMTRGTWNTLSQVILGANVIQHRKVQQLKWMLEMLYEKEADVLLAILTKNLTTLYPNLTHDVICAALGESTFETH